MANAPGLIESVMRHSWSWRGVSYLRSSELISMLLLHLHDGGF